MKLKELLKLTTYQFGKLSLAEKMRAVKYMEKVANKRIERLEETGLDTASYALHARNNRKFKTRLPESVANAEAYHKGRKAKLHKRLEEAFSSSSSFLSAKSSTIKGAERIYNRAVEDFESQNELYTASKAQQNKFWEAYNRLKDEHPDLLQSGDYMKRRQQLYDIMVTHTKTGKLRFKSIDKAVEEMNRQMTEQYTASMLDKAESDSPYNNPKTFGESVE